SAGITGALFHVHPADECAMAEILVTEVCARRLLAAGDCFCGCRYDQVMCQRSLYFRRFPLFLRPVFSIGLFLRYFNDLSCIWPAPTFCKSPVFFLSVFLRAGCNARTPSMRHETRQTSASLHMRLPRPSGEGDPLHLGPIHLVFGQHLFLLL